MGSSPGYRDCEGKKNRKARLWAGGTHGPVGEEDTCLPVAGFGGAWEDVKGWKLLLKQVLRVTALLPEDNMTKHLRVGRFTATNDFPP